MLDVQRGPTQAQGLRDWCEAIPPDCRHRVVEIGSFAGESAVIFAEYFEAVHCVDSWCGVNSQHAYAPFVERVTAPAHKDRIFWIRADSADAAHVFAKGSLCALYIDAGHEYEEVKRDTQAWRHKVKSGGWIGGHDWSSAFPGVEKAVREAFPNVQPARFRDSSWLVRCAP